MNGNVTYCSGFLKCKTYTLNIPAWMISLLKRRVGGKLRGLIKFFIFPTHLCFLALEIPGPWKFQEKVLWSRGGWWAGWNLLSRVPGLEAC